MNTEALKAMPENFMIKPSETISGKIDQIFQQADHLEQALNNLMQRITPVLKPLTGDSFIDDKPEVLSELAEKLARINDHLHRLTRYTDRITDAVDL